MELCGNSLPQDWAVVELSAHDEVTDIYATDINALLTKDKSSNYVICHFDEELNSESEIFKQLPPSEFLRDIIVFNASRWKSALCNSDACCPQDGKLYQAILTTCRAISMWQDALADWILGKARAHDDILATLENLDVRDWVLSQAISSTNQDWREFLTSLSDTNPQISLFTILAGFYYTKSDDVNTSLYLQKAKALELHYPLLTLLDSGVQSSMPPHVLIQSLQRFEVMKQNIRCVNKASLSPKASPPTATRTGER